MTNAKKRRRGTATVLGSVAILLAGCGGEQPAASPPPVDSVVAESIPAEDGEAVPAPPAGTAVAADATLPTVPSTVAADLSPSSVVMPTIVPLPTPAHIPFEDESPEPVVPLGSIAIPAIGIDRPMFEGIRLPTFDLGPGHWPGTAMPGQIGNVVVGGHRTESHADFGDLDLLQPGDEVIFTDNTGARFTYQVERTEIIDPFAAPIVYQTRENTATLFACHPKGTTDQRIVVRLTQTT